MPTLTILQAEGLVVRTLTRCRTNVDNARSVARALVAAEADGLKGHGLSRVPMYAAQAKARKVDGLALATATRPRPGLIAVDAGYGFAFPALEIAETPPAPAESAVATEVRAAAGADAGSDLFEWWDAYQRLHASQYFDGPTRRWRGDGGDDKLETLQNTEGKPPGLNCAGCV